MTTVPVFGDVSSFFESFPLPHYITLQCLHSSNILKAVRRTVALVEAVNTDAELILFTRAVF